MKTNRAKAAYLKVAFALLNLLHLGAEGQNRTDDTVIFSHVLYQLSYLGI